ncbi:MAG: PilZ domain-containing protein [Sphingomicrobium sp.]
MSSKAPETTLISLSRAVPMPPDRRDGERYLTLLRVGSMTVGGRRQLCLIRNVSCGGMMIRTYSEMERGTRLSIEFKHGESVVGTVRWVEGGDIGLMFDYPIDVGQLLEAAMTGPRPRMPRVELHVAASVRTGAVSQRVLALDISQGGMKVRSTEPLRLREQVVVTLFGYPPIAGTVRWAEGDCFGISFNQLLPLQALIRWLKSQQQPALQATG